MSVKVLLDTDIGTDIDDAVCLAYLLVHPDCDLLGITTVTGEPEKRAMLASAICRRAGRDVPIYPGAERPLVVEQKQPRAQQAEALGSWDHQNAFPRGEAIEFMRETIRSHPGEVTLLSIAPLTNLGLLFSVDPEIPSLLKGLVMMCGLFKGPIPKYGPLEWNAIGDPHATAIVYRAHVLLHRSIGLDVTTSVNMSPEDFRNTFRSDLFKPIQDFADIWFRDWPGTTFHDPLAAATIFDRNACGFTKGYVEIELTDQQSLGFTRWTEDPAGGHEVAFEVNPAAFFEHFISTVHP
ncbi:MAG: putative nucleosidase [Bacteroidetes bacterium]|jgi:inosine-uridine nucleoside N-ribohydrolase|nr:putative nucleosidase [Bacteroidota bacterium]